MTQYKEMDLKSIYKFKLGDFHKSYIKMSWHTKKRTQYSRPKFIIN